MAATRRKLRIGSVGIGGMGNGHLSAHAANKRVKIVALCDLIPERCAKAIETHGLDPKTHIYTNTGSTSFARSRMPSTLRRLRR